MTDKEGFFETIDGEHLISPSLEPYLFGNRGARSAPIRQFQTFPKLAHSICMFYAAVIQARIMSEALKTGLTITEYLKNDRVSKTLKGVWSDGSYDLSRATTVFSFLYDCSSLALLSDMFDEDYESARSDASEDYISSLEGKKQIDVVSVQANFLKLLRYLKSLSTMELKPEKGVVVINGSPIFFKPFMFIKSGSVFITSRANRGERNGLLELSIFPYFKSFDSAMKIYQLDVKSRERYNFFCKAMEINPEWYKREEYLGNCAFVVNLSDILSKLLIYNIHVVHGKEGHIQKYLSYYFEGTDLENDSRNIPIKIQADGSSIIDGERNQFALQNLLIGFIIKYGAYHTTYCVMFDNDPYNEEDHKEYSKINYRNMMDKMVELLITMNISPVANPESVLDHYRDVIEYHVDKVKEIIPERSLPFRKRVAEIYAEQRTNCIMNLLGSDSQIFLDQEDILSIQDYYDMVEYRNNTLSSVMYDVTKFLVRFYMDITGKTIDVPKDLTPDKYVRIFHEFCKSCEDNPLMESKIGRKHLCNNYDLSDLLDEATSISDWSPGEGGQVTKDYFFVSYCHEDSTIVKAAVREWKSRGYNIVYDKDVLHQGQSWRTEVVKTLLNPQCKGAFVFLSERSIIKEPVRYEIEQILHIGSKRELNNLSEDNEFPFLVPINMHPDKSLDWMTDTKYRLEPESQDFSNADFIRRQFPNDILCIKYDENFIEESSNVLKERLSAKTSVVDYESVTPAEKFVLSYLAFLKTGTKHVFDPSTHEIFEKICEGKDPNIYRCIYPLLISVDEKRVKRDKITIIGFDILNGKRHSKNKGKVMITSSALTENDYFCIPNIKSSGECGEWISNPYLISSEVIRNWQEN